MNFSPKDFVTVNEILSDVLEFVDDTELRDHSRGYYVSQVQQAMEKLAFDTFFDKKTEIFAVPDNLNLEMPKGSFNMRQIYLTNGEICDITNSQNVYWKRNYFTKGGGYAAKDTGVNRNDPFYDDRYRDYDIHQSNARKAANGGIDPELNNSNSVSNTYFFNIQNGIIMFSPQCRSFKNAILVYNGVGTDIGEVPIVPLFLREAVMDFTTERALRIKKAKATIDFNKWRVLWADTAASLGSSESFSGSWYRAEVRVKQMDSKAREDLKEYFARFNY